MSTRFLKCFSCFLQITIISRYKRYIDATHWFVVRILDRPPTCGLWLVVWLTGKTKKILVASIQNATPRLFRTALHWARSEKPSRQNEKKRREERLRKNMPKTTNQPRTMCWCTVSSILTRTVNLRFDSDFRKNNDKLEPGLVFSIIFFVNVWLFLWIHVTCTAYETQTSQWALWNTLSRRNLLIHVTGSCNVL